MALPSRRMWMSPRARAVSRPPAILVAVPPLGRIHRLASRGEGGLRRDLDHDIPQRQATGLRVRSGLLGILDGIITVPGAVTEAVEHRQAGIACIKSDDEELGPGQRVVGHGRLLCSK